MLRYLKKQPQYALGLHLDGSSIKTALLRKTGKGIEVDLLQTFASDVKPFDILKTPLAGKHLASVSGIDAHHTLFRKLNINLTHRRSVLAALPFQVESLLSHPLEDLLILPHFENPQNGSTQVSLFAVQKKAMESHLADMASMGANPDIVSCEPAALARFALFHGHSSSFFFHFGMDKSCYGLLEGGRVSFCFSMKKGIRVLIEAFFKDHPDEEMKQIDLSSANPEASPHLHASIESLRKECERAVLSLQKKGGTYPLLVIADNEQITHLETLFSMPIELLSHRYAIPFGLALEGLSSDAKTIQFRDKAYAHPDKLKKRKHYLLGFLISCATLAIATPIFDAGYVGKQERGLAKKLAAYTSSDLSLPGKDLHQELRQWETALSKEKITFPFIPTTPKVADVLAWLETHPQLNASQKDGVEMQNISYSLIKYPKWTENVEPYQAKVEIQLTFSSLRLAKEFHDALEKDPLINHSLPMTWKPHQNTYHTSFFLK